MTGHERRPGRPKGDGIDDDRLLLEVAILQALHVTHTVRSAVYQLVELELASDVDRVVRRVTGKWRLRKDVYSARARTIVREFYDAPVAIRQVVPKQRPEARRGSLSAGIHRAMDLQLMRHAVRSGDIATVASLLGRCPRLERVARSSTDPGIQLAVRFYDSPVLKKLVVVGPSASGTRGHPVFRRMRAIDDAISREFPRVAVARARLAGRPARPSQVRFGPLRSSMRGTAAGL